jgi:hypothetical protein
MKSAVASYGRVNGISRVGDLLRLYMFPWLAFYVSGGNPADKVLFITIASLIQAVPSLILSHYAARFVRHFSPLTSSIWANGGMGVVTLVTALVVLGGGANKSFVLLAWVLIGLMEVVYYPARDCLYATLAAGDQKAREEANRFSVSVYHVGRATISVVMMGVVLLLGPVQDEMPRSAIAVALLFDAATFAIVVMFLLTLKGGAYAPTPQREEVHSKVSLREAAQVPGAIPILVCILAIFSFAYSSFFFNFGFYKEFVGVGERERQVTFYIAMLAAACGGFFGGRVWKVSFRNLALGMVASCVSEGMLAFVPTNHFWGTIWLACNSCLSVMLFTIVFDGIVPQLVQGLARNAEVSASISLVKEGLSPLLVVVVSAIASCLNAPRQVLVGSCLVALVIVVVTLCTRRASIQRVIDGNTPAIN